MVVVRVLVFASLKDILGSSERKVEIAAGTSVAGLVDSLGRSYPALVERVPYLRFAVNESMVNSDQLLAEGDEVALMPPTSGGCG